MGDDASGQEQEPAEAYSAAQMFRELDFPVTSLRPGHTALQEHVVAALDPFVALLFAAETQTTGEAGFAVRQLLTRVINDLVVAFHLITHGYVNQGYNTMRMAYEACDLIELLANDPSEAKLWVNTKRGWVDFRASSVRERLGKEKVDAIYDHFCEHSHPRFGAARLTGFMTKVEDDDTAHVVLRLGPFLIDEHPAVLHSASFLVQMVGLLGLRFSHLVEAGALSEEVWTAALKQSIAAQREATQVIADGLAELGQPEAQALADAFDELLQQILDKGIDPSSGTTGSQ